MKKFIGFVFVLIYFGLAGCNAQGDTGSSANNAADNTVTETSAVEDEFPEEALAIRPETDEEVERREEGNTGESETYYVSIVSEEEIGCMKRRVEVRGSFRKDNSEHWSPGQATEWDSERTETNVKIREDASACGGFIIVLQNSVFPDSFEVDGGFITFYAEVPVYNWWTGET